MAFKVQLVIFSFALMSLSNANPCNSACTGAPEPLPTVAELLNNLENCDIKNRKYSEPFYPATIHYDSERRMVFTYKKKTCNADCHWNFEEVGLEGSTYKIKSTKYNEYFYAAAGDLDLAPKERRVLTWIPKSACDSECKWDLKVAGKDANGKYYFTIQNPHYDNEYLYATGTSYDKDRREMATTNAKLRDEKQRHWFIECQ